MTSLDMYNWTIPRTSIVSNQYEESISIQRVNEIWASAYGPAHDKTLVLIECSAINVTFILMLLANSEV